ncbi:MAG: Oligopeptide transport system permease protein OppC [Chlamydiae bacterium]|nr:Oligopeptide transport system permease protein OppC [Chlamydiota bacterium]
MEQDLYKPYIYAAKEEHIGKPFSYLKHVLSQFRQSKQAVFCLSILGFLFLLSILGPWISPYTYYGISLESRNLSPCLSHFLGTDDLGRDLLTRLCLGIRISLFVGVAAALIDLVIGVWYGMIAAFLGKQFDQWMMRFCDILDTIPFFLIVISLMVVIGPGLSTIILAMCLTSWIPMARIVRTQILATKSKEYVHAAQTLGAGFFRILVRYLFPSAISPMIVTMTLTIPTAIFTEAILSFLGLGVQIPIASLGTLASDGLSSLRYYPWRLFFPAGMICLIIFAFNQIADALKDALDPKT